MPASGTIRRPVGPRGRAGVRDGSQEAQRKGSFLIVFKSLNTNAEGSQMA